MRVHGYEVPLCRQDFIEIDQELLSLYERDDDAAMARIETLLCVMEESVRAYRRQNIQLAPPITTET